MSAALLLQVATLALLPPTTVSFSGTPPETCKYQGYTFQLLHTHVCLNYRLCYCQVSVSNQHLNPTLPPPHKTQFNQLSELDEGGEDVTDNYDFITTTPPLYEAGSETPHFGNHGNQPLFVEWKPKPAECACWCSGISYEARADTLYQSDDTCIIDETDCYCELEKELLWANQMRHLYDYWDTATCRDISYQLVFTSWNSSYNHHTWYWQYKLLWMSHIMTY